MSRAWETRLTVGLGVVLLAFGVAETTRVLVTGDSAWALTFWFGSLVGGGALVLVGRLVSRRRPWLSFTMVTLGALAGTLATMWTLVLPLVAAAVVVLSFRTASGAAAPV